jgi:multidrug efflux system outer membrane protein
MSKMKNLEQYYQLKREEADKLDHSVNIARQLYMNSRCTYLDVLMDQRDAMDAKMELLEAKEQQLSSLVDVYQSVGGGGNLSPSAENKK